VRDILKVVYWIVEYLIITILVLTLFWDTLAWLTGNEHSWRNTQFQAPLICFILLIMTSVGGAILVGAFKVIDSLFNSSSQGKPPDSPFERHKWANRLPPYDK